MVTREGIDALIERVRPFLRAHGGDIEVVTADGKPVSVQFTGACAGCPSAHMILTLAGSAAQTASPEAHADTGPIVLDDRIREFEAGLIRRALEVSGGNKSKAAKLLGVKRSTLGDRIQRCGLDRRPD